MNVAGYVRQPPGREDPDTAFAQSERVRRWALDTGNDLVAICQDSGSAPPFDRPGYAALLDIVRSSTADAVVVARLDALSPDVVLQEIMVSDIRAAGATIIATGPDDQRALAEGEGDHARLVVRGVVDKLLAYREAYGLAGSSDPQVAPALAPHDVVDDDDDANSVVIELIAPDR